MNFDKKAEQFLSTIFEELEGSDGIQDVDLEDGSILQITARNGEYIINKHGANKQIWYSSPVSKPMRVDIEKAHEVRERLMEDLKK